MTYPQKRLAIAVVKLHTLDSMGDDALRLLCAKKAIPGVCFLAKRSVFVWNIGRRPHKAEHSESNLDNLLTAFIMYLNIRVRPTVALLDLSIRLYNSDKLTHDDNSQ